jgi:hypothetical protein
MDEQKPASGKEQPFPEGPFRRAYAWPILWGPWVTSAIGLALLVFGMTVNSPVPVRVTALGLGPITIVAGLLLPRMQGSMELSATGFKGQIDSVPMSLVLAHRAAEKAIPEGEPDRDRRAWEATNQALRDYAPMLGNLLVLSRAEHDHLASMDEALGHIRPRTDPPDEPPLGDKPS